MAAKESIISRVQKLLNVAMDERAPEAERILAQERADKLMAQHMIDQMDLKQDDPNRSRVTSTMWKFQMHYEFSEAIKSLLSAVVMHTTCRASMQMDYHDRETPFHITIVGTPENIAYAERLWMIVFTELVRNMFPRWDSQKTFDANVYTFVKGGFKWREIHEIAYKHAPDAIPDPYPRDGLRYDWQTARYVSDGGRLKRSYNRELKRLGEEVENHTSRHGAYRVSYVSSFVSTIRNRLFEMRSSSTESVSDKDKYALALRNSQDEADAEFYRLFPQFDPETIRRQREAAYAAENARRATMTQEQIDLEDAQRAREEERARKHYERLREKKYDSAGWAKGSAVAKKVNLNSDTPIQHSKKEIG
ncbi:hypothetical protein GJ25_gp051 [Mycobacterium phage Hawkeye]|uniref:DUF2786 domain-containing protein n=1 Tax=Mycobacterium phage Hawkeye TaxID=1458711 RepID=X2KN77_9CAUD|nr:hypothetical protein GJ25_gp051 [Mycobacterium phage Hawkeye]AHN84062.1 hypothetical protein PBI_HAWKEYE_51 [Mycobacterium phage Hawkeye]